jgi:CheY-like chemotaxis protein
MSRFDALRVLIVEDEPVVAMCLEDILEGLGCAVVGPAARLSEGMTLAERGAIDAAILDINLGGSDRSTPIAELLRDRGIPFAFASGYGAVPEGFAAETLLIGKPYGERDVEEALRRLIG